MISHYLEKGVDLDKLTNLNMIEKKFSHRLYAI